MKHSSVRPRTGPCGMIQKGMLGAIRFYQRQISPTLGPACRFTPTCSQYAYTAIERFGALKGGWLALKRLLRCNPFCRGGYDPVPDDPHSIILRRE